MIYAVLIRTNFYTYLKYSTSDVSYHAAAYLGLPAWKGTSERDIRRQAKKEHILFQWDNKENQWIQNGSRL